MLAKVIAVDTPNNHGFTPLMHAVLYESPAVTERLHYYGADLSKVDLLGYPDSTEMKVTLYTTEVADRVNILHRECAEAYANYTRQQTSHKFDYVADILMLKNQVHAVKNLLLRCGDDLVALRSLGSEGSLLHRAASRCNPLFVELFMDTAMDLQMEDADGCTPVYYALRTEDKPHYKRVDQLMHLSAQISCGIPSPGSLSTSTDTNIIHILK